MTQYNLQVDRKDIAFKRILVPLDGSKCSERAAREAIRIAKCAGSELTFLNVMVIPISFISGEIWEPMKKMEDRLEQRGKLCLEAARLEAASAGVEARTAIVEQVESPADGITDYARKNNIDLILIGTRGLGSFKSFILGSVTTEVIRSASCSVLVMR